MFEKNADMGFKKHALGIILLGCLAMYFSCCLASDALNIIEPAFTEKMGWSYSSVSMPFTVANYILIVLGFGFSTFILKNGTRIFSVLSFSTLAIGTFFIGVAYSMPCNTYLFFLFGGLLTKFSALAVQMVCFQLCANWFHSSRGRILGIITIAAPLNTATSVTLLTIGTKQIGLTACYTIITGILLISVFLAFIFGISEPKELGFAVDGLPSEEIVEIKNEKTSSYQSKWTFKKLFSKPETWALMIGFGIFNGTIGPVMGFFIVRMTEVGIGTAMSLTILSASSFIGIFLSYVFGWIDDKFSTPVAARILGVTFVIACILFYIGNVNCILLLWVAAIMMASIVGGTPNLHPSSIIHVFGAKEYQAANRYIAIGVGILSSFGVQLMSILLDKTGSLSIGYLIFAILNTIGTICMFLVRHQYDDEI